MTRKLKYLLFSICLPFSLFSLLQTPFTGALGFKHGLYYIDRNPVGYWILFFFFIFLLIFSIDNLIFLIKTRKGIITREKDIIRIQSRLHLAASNASTNEKLYFDRSTVEYWRLYLDKDFTEKYVAERISRSQAEELFKIYPHAAV